MNSHDFFRGELVYVAWLLRFFEVSVQQLDRGKPRILNISAPHFLFWPTAAAPFFKHLLRGRLVFISCVLLVCFKIIKQKIRSKIQNLLDLLASLPETQRKH